MNEIKKLKFWQKFLGVILSIGLFFTFMICIPMHFIKQVTNDDFYYKILSNINYEDLVNSVDNQYGEIQEMIIDFIEDNDIDKKEAVKFLSNKKLNKLLSKFISDCTKNSLYGDKIDIIDINDVNIILDETNINNSELREVIALAIDDINNDIESLDIDNSYHSIKRLFEYNYMSFILISSALCYLILALMTNSLINPLKFIGVPCIISGSLLTIVSIIAHRILIIALIELNISESLFSSIGRFTYFRMYFISIGLIIIGILLCITKRMMLKKNATNNTDMMFNN